MPAYIVHASDTAFGTYPADTAAQALDLCAQDAGYASEADMIARLEQPSNLIATEVEQTYAVVAVTEYYGPETRRSIHSLHESEAEARAVAEGNSPDYDASVGCCRLAHNQASATALTVGTAERFDGDLWDFSTGAEDDAACAAARAALGRDLGPEDDTSQYLLEAMADNGRYVLRDPESLDLYLVTLNE